MKTGTLVFTVLALFTLYGVAPCSAATTNLMTSIPYFTGPQAGAADGEPGSFDDAQGGSWQHYRGSQTGGLGALIPNQWSDARARWETVVAAGSGRNYLPGPVLETTTDQGNSIIVYTAPLDGTYHLGGTLFLDGTNLNSGGAAPEAKIRGEVVRFANQPPGYPDVLASIVVNAPLGQDDVVWDLGAEPGLTNIPMQAHERIAIGIRKVAAAGELLGHLSNVTFSVPHTTLTVITNVPDADAVSLTIPSESAAEYVIEATTNLDRTAFANAYTVGGSGRDRTVLIPATEDTQFIRFVAGPPSTPVPFFTGVDGQEGTYVDAAGTTWQHYRNQVFNGIPAGPNDWEDDRQRWENVDAGQQANSDSTYEKGPTLVSRDNQAYSTLVIRPARAGTYSFDGTLTFDETGLDAGDGIRSEVLLFPKTNSSVTVVLASFSTGSTPGDTSWDIGAEAGVQNFTLEPGDALGIDIRHTGETNDEVLEGQLFGLDPVQLIGPGPIETGYVGVVIISDTALAFDATTQCVYRVDVSTNVATDGWTRVPVRAVGNGRILQIFDPDGYDSNKIYRVIGEFTK